MTTMENYEDIIMTDVKKYQSLAEEQRKERQDDLEAIGVINVYSQIYILDSDLRKLGIAYERIISV